MEFKNGKHNLTREIAFENLDQSINGTIEFLSKYFELLKLKDIDFIDETGGASVFFINESLSNILKFFTKFNLININEIDSDNHYDVFIKIQSILNKYGVEKILLLVNQFDKNDEILKSFRIISVQNFKINKLLSNNGIEEKLENRGNELLLNNGVNETVEFTRDELYGLIA